MSHPPRSRDWIRHRPRYENPSVWIHQPPRHKPDRPGTPRSRFRVSEGAADFDYAELAEADGEGADAIAALLSSAPIAVDELIRQSGASAAAVHMALLELELAGELEREGSGLVRRSGI